MHEQIVTEPNYVANRPVYYNVDSEINSPTKVFVAKITDGSPSPTEVDYSHVGFTEILNIQAIPVVNETDPGNATEVYVMSYDESSASLNKILADGTDTSGTTFFIRVEGY